MKTSFTKGEWFIEDYDSMLEITSKGHGSICTVECSYQLEEMLIDPTDEQQANAHLISAAPDMYKALEALSKGEGLQPGTTIESILLKARGES